MVPRFNNCTGRWSDEEHLRYLEGKKMFNSDWKLIADYVRTRRPIQVKSHDQKYMLRTFRRRRFSPLNLRKFKAIMIDRGTQVNMDLPIRRGSDDSISTEDSPTLRPALPFDFEDLENVLYHSL